MAGCSEIFGGKLGIVIRIDGRALKSDILLYASVAVPHSAVEAETHCERTKGRRNRIAGATNTADIRRTRGPRHHRRFVLAP